MPIIEAKTNLERMIQEVPLREEERAAVEDGLVAVEKLYARLLDIPTPAGPTPLEIEKKMRRELPILHRFFGFAVRLTSILTWKVSQLVSLTQSRFINGEEPLADQPSPRAAPECSLQSERPRPAAT